MEIRIEPKEDMLKFIEKKLDSVNGDANDILKKAVNDTAKQTVRELTKRAGQTYVAKGGARQYKQASQMKNATKRKPIATVTFKGEMREIKEFKASPLTVSNGNNRPKVTKGKVLKSGKLTPLIKDKLKAFTVKFKNVSKSGEVSEHLAVVERDSTRKMKSNPKKDALVKILSPSIPHAIGSKKVFGKVEPSIQNNLRDNVYKFINKALGG